MISIVIPLYNKGKLVTRALESILRQEYDDYEVVVVDDGSTDDSVAVVTRFQSRFGDRLRVVSQANAGVGAARNRGVAESQGEFVAFLDADDEWKPSHLSSLASLARLFPDKDVYATNYENIMADGRCVVNTLHNVRFAGHVGVIDNYFEVAAKSNPPLWTSALMVRRSALTAVGGFPEGIKSGEDLLLWARLVAHSDVAYDMTSTAVYHRGFSNPRPPEAMDEVGRQFELLYRDNPRLAGLKRYIAMWYNMRMSRCLAHRMYGRAVRALCKSLRYRPTLRIAKPLLQYTIFGLKR